MRDVTRVTATDAALDLIDRLRQKHGPLMFHQSGGCCDGSSPMCYPRDAFLVGSGDVKLGEIGGVPFFMSASQFEYWQHTHLIIDVVPGRGGMFSLEGPEGPALPHAIPPLFGRGVGRAPRPAGGAGRLANAPTGFAAQAIGERLARGAAGPT